jgi:hypothetical protein
MSPKHDLKILQKNDGKRDAKNDAKNNGKSDAKKYKANLWSLKS